ncbi:D-alanyl-D-alanine carboxypeptidase family protein [Cryobacterium psychrophilum]|uniref:D-alanyl-D-alanine carboxypeptidase family protein n=2 Tax=Cryobacterium psychrophilum TaxID=41988 RepID=A0A4Y8KNX3_9MICO|nr:D-alanyl-D-alanine carboxypeptidase family protein [Cryobacterium psychrophilum]
MVCVALAAASVVLGVVTGTSRETDAAPTAQPSATASAPPTRPVPTAAPTAVPVASFDRAALSIDDPASLWVVVNKQRSLRPADYSPSDLVTVPVAHTWQPQLRQEASAAAAAMFAAAREEAGLSLASNSAYRGFAAQARVYSALVNAEGVASADQSIARPGNSEHQTGLAIDVGAESGRCSLNPCFADTPEGLWLTQNSVRFGFLLRYPADKVAVTGYEFEPWHFRYIGTDLAVEMRSGGVSTLEEFFGLPPAPGYP